MCVYVYVYVCVCACVFLCSNMLLCVRVCMCVCQCVCVCLRLCVYFCVRLCSIALTPITSYVYDFVGPSGERRNRMRWQFFRGLERACPRCTTECGAHFVAEGCTVPFMKGENAILFVWVEVGVCDTTCTTECAAHWVAQDVLTPSNPRANCHLILSLVIDSRAVWAQVPSG